MKWTRAVALLLAALIWAGCRWPVGPGQAVPEPAWPDSPLTDAQFLQTHGWTAAEQVAVHQVRLPESFADAPGAYPVGVHWAHASELSASLGPGFDLRQRAGQVVTARLYRLEETLPDDHPVRVIRAVVLRHEGKLIGGYLDRLGGYGPAAALDGRTFAHAVGKPFGQWVEDAGIVDWDHSAYRRLARMTPEQVVAEFFKALDRRDYARAYTLLTLPERMTYLYANRDPGALYNPGFAQAFPDGLENITGARVLSVSEPRDTTGERSWGGDPGWRPHQAVQFGVSLELRYAREITAESGQTHRFLGLARPTPEAPWLIDGMGTGP